MLSYIDPGAGAVLMTALAGGVAGVAVFFKIYYHRLLGVFSKRHRAKYEQATTDLMGEEVTQPHTESDASV